MTQRSTAESKDWRSLVRPETLNQLIANHSEQLPHRGKRSERNFMPACRLFNPTGPGTWLITECDEDGLAFGLCDVGYPELGYISMQELAEFNGLGGLGIEEDLHWRPTKTLNQYAEEARRAGYIAR